MSILSDEIREKINAAGAYRQEQAQDRESYLREYAWLLNHSSPTVRSKVADKVSREVTDPQERDWLVNEVANIATTQQKAREYEYSQKGYAGRFTTNIKEHLAGAGEGFLEQARTAQDITKLAIGKGKNRADVQFARLLEGAKQSGNPDISKGRGALHKAAAGMAGIAPDVVTSAVLAGHGAKAVAAGWAAYQFPRSRDDFLDAGLSESASALAAAPVAAGTGAIESLLPSPLESGGAVGAITKKLARRIIGRSTLKPMTQRIAKVALETAGNYATEAWIEEGLQAALQEGALRTAGKLSPNVEERPAGDILGKAAEAMKSASIPMLPWVGAGGITRGVKEVQRFKKFAAGSKQAQIDRKIQEHVKNGTVPSRREWRQLGLPTERGGWAPSRQTRSETIAVLAEDTSRNDQIRFAYENMAPTRDQWKLWGLPAEADRGAAARLAFIREKFGLAIPLPTEAGAGLVEAAQAPVGPAEGLRAQEGMETPQLPPQAPEQAVEAQVLSEDETVGLNKEIGNNIREAIGLDVLGEDAVQSWESVKNDVATNRGDEKALQVAKVMIETNRPITAHEHVAMAIKTWKLMDDLKTVEGIQARAAEDGNGSAHMEATKNIETITDQIDLLTMGDRYGLRGGARGLSIAQIRLNREKYDVASVMQSMQAAKGPKGTLTKKEKVDIVKKSTEESKLASEEAQIKQEEIESGIAEDKELADKIIRANKPRRISGEAHKKAAAEREEIKKRIRQLGLRVNDITGVPVEGVYLLGRLGITYVKEGVGTMAELVDRLRADVPGLNLTDQDVYKALISRGPKEKARVRSEANARVAKFRSIAKIHVELENIANGIPTEKGQRAPVPGDLKILQGELAKARHAYYESKINSAKLERAIEMANKLEDDIKNGVTRIKADPKSIPSELKEIRGKVRELINELNIDEELRKINKQLETGEVLPTEEREKRPVSKRLEKKQIELKQKRAEIRQMIANAAPLTAMRVLQGIADTMKSVKATADISFILRQNGWMISAHPVRSFKPTIKSLKAILSENSSEQIYNGIINSKNGLLYGTYNLQVLDASSQDARQRSEVYQQNIIERSKGVLLLPFREIMKASSRHAVAIGNLIRTSAFDQFLSNNPNATSEELRAMAAYINIATGIGDVKFLGPTVRYLNVAFFSPKFAVSRFQTPYQLYKYWNLPRVRKQISRDMVGFVADSLLVLFLAHLAGFDVEFLDPDDPDWGKIRIGNQRFDFLHGFQQPARLILRAAKAPFSESDFDYIDVLGRFAAYKLSPIFTTPIELLRGKTATGQETTKIGTIARTILPLIGEDTYEAWKIQGIAAGARAFTASTLGGGVSTYKDSETATRRKVKNYRSRGQYGKAKRVLNEWNLENPKNKIINP